MSKIHKTIELSNLDDTSNRSILKKDTSTLNNLEKNIKLEEDEEIVIQLDIEKVVDVNKIIKILSINLFYKFLTITWYSFQLLNQFSQIDQIYLAIIISNDYFLTLFTMIFEIKYLIEVKILEKKKDNNEFNETKIDLSYIHKLDFIITWGFYEWYLKYMDYLLYLYLTTSMSLLSYLKLVLLFFNWNLYQWLKTLYNAGKTNPEIRC